MKLIVEIDDEIYKTWRQEGKYASHSYAQKIILNGTPLPKGHGDLVDFDGLCKEYWDGNYMEIHKDDLSNIKPIIEADKED